MEKIKKHIRNRKYMDSISRCYERKSENQEYFTPTNLVNSLLDKVDHSVFLDPDKTILDPTCGDGQFLGEVLIRKLENGISHEQALKTIYGVDIMPDNVEETKKHLLAGHEEYRHIVNRNIVCANALAYDFQFGEDYEDENGFIHKAMKPEDSLTLADKDNQNKSLESSEPRTTFYDLFEF